MADRDVRNIFRQLHSKIVNTVSPESVMEHLLSNQIISEDDCSRLRQVPVSTDRCGKLLALLYDSPDPQAFIYLRLALLDEYPWIVDEIDRQVPSLTDHLQQLQLNRLSDGKLLLYEHNVLNIDF